MRLLNSGFTELTPEDFFDKGTFIHTQLTGNTYYATTNPTLAAIQTLLTPLDTALKMPPGQARDGAIATARPPLEETLQDLAENLEQATPGNLQKLSTTGFDLRKTPAQTSEPPATPAKSPPEKSPGERGGAVSFRRFGPGEIVSIPNHR